MNILQLSSHFQPNIGGVETHLNDLVLGLVKRNYQVTVLTYIPLTTDISAPFYEKTRNLMIYRIPWIKGWFYKLVDKPILEFLYLFPGLFLAAPFVISKRHIQVIHAHGLVAGVVGIFWAKMFKKRVVISTHSLYNFPEKGIYRTFIKFVLSQSDICLTLSKKSTEELINLEIDQKKIRQFTYWIDINMFKPSKSKNLKSKFNLNNQFVVLFVGRLVKEKGLNVLIQAVKQIKGKITLIVAGNGPMRDDVVKETQNNDHIRFVGSLAAEELANYYNLGDLLVIPSIHDEGFGRVILESLACGTPVLGSDRGSIPEAINQDVGRLVKVSVKKLVQEITYLKNHRNVLKKLKQNARAYSVKRYSERNIETIIKTYD